MTWTVTYYMGVTPYTDVIHDIVVDRRIQSLNQATIKTMLDIQIDTVVTLTKDETTSSTWIVKKKTLEDDVVWKYELVEMMGELADQVVYEGLKVFNVAGQTIRSIVTECLTGTGWTIGDAGKLYVGISGGNYTWLVVGGNTDLMNGGYIFNIGDTVRLSGTIPAPFNGATVYYVVAASSSGIQLSPTEGGSAITAIATGQVMIDKCVKYMSVYWGKTSAAVFKVVCDIGGMALWGENDAKRLCYGYNRSTVGDITSSVYKCVPVEESHKRGYDRVIVLGQTDSIKGEAGTGTKVVVYKYEDATTADEAKSLAEVILKDLGKVSVRKTLTIAPTMNIYEGSNITYDGVKYFVFDVKETYEHIEIGIGAMLKTVFDKLGSKLKEVTGEVSTGTNSTFDGGLQNMGAPSVNCLISVDVDTDTILVPDVELYYSNTDRVVFTSPGTVPSPLVEGTVYYVRDVDAVAETFKVAETSGGVAINLTTNGSGLIRARNLDSQSIPAEFIVNVPDVDKIGNVEFSADFSAYRDQMSIGDEVEFLSVPSIITTTASVNTVSIMNTTPVYIPSSDGMQVTTGDVGFQFGLVNYFVELVPIYDGRYRYNRGILTLQVTYDGVSWNNLLSWTVYNPSVSLDPSSTTFVSESCLISGNSLRVSTTKVRLKFQSQFNHYSGHLNGRVNCDVVPRHNHVIDKQNNVLQSTLAKNVKCYITNSQYTDQLIYTWNGTVNSEQVLTDLYDYLRNGQNILKFYSESPGSVYLTGTYESYGI